jgi:ankyrin repeat protein
MNKFVQAIKNLDLDSIREMVGKDPKWFKWAEPDGKNALHYLCALSVGDSAEKAETSLKILKFFLKNGMDINSIHKIAEKNCGHFPATPLWYAYTRGRNEKIYKYLLNNGAVPENCMWAIAWYDDVKAAKLFIKHGAKLDKKSKPNLNDLFLGAFSWRKYKFAEWLLNEGADVNAPGPRGYTALMFAVKRKEEDTITFLLRYGADPDKKSEDGLSARKLAGQKGPKRIARLLEK